MKASHVFARELPIFLLISKMISNGIGSRAGKKSEVVIL
jgi:hypothetical protein